MIIDFCNKKFAETKYGGKEYYVVDCFEYKGRKYYFIVDKIAVGGEDTEIDTLNSMSKSNFIYKIYDRYFNNVSDEKLFDELFDIEKRRSLLKAKKSFSS